MSSYYVKMLGDFVECCKMIVKIAYKAMEGYKWGIVRWVYWGNYFIY